MIQSKKDCNVLFLVNSFSLQADLKESLITLAFSLEEHNDAEEAMLLWEKDPSKYEIALVEDVIGRFSGLDIAKRMKSINSALKIVVLSSSHANMESSGKTLQIEKGVDALIQKPIQQEELIRIMLNLSPYEYHKKMLILLELEAIGADINSFTEFNLIQLQAILNGFKTCLHNSKKRAADSSMRLISDIDKRMLSIFLASNERVSSLHISRTLGTPLTTVQRRRKRLETEFLETSYRLKLEKFGLRKAQILISVDKGSAVDVGRKLLRFEEILSISRPIGMDTVDLYAEVIFSSNSGLLDLIERIRFIDGVKETKWIEIVKVFGKNPIPSRMFDAIETKNSYNSNIHKA